LRLNPNQPAIHSSLLFYLNHNPLADPDVVFAEHCRWGKLHTAAISPLAHTNQADPERRLRIGYVSGDFRIHPLIRYFEPVLANHDPARVYLVCYAEVRFPDEVTDRLKALAHEWRWTCGVPDAKVAEQIQRDGIDILVDLAGHSSDHRLGVFAHKPAPIQATW